VAISLAALLEHGREVGGWESGSGGPARREATDSPEWEQARAPAPTPWPGPGGDCLLACKRGVVAEQLPFLAA